MFYLFSTVDTISASRVKIKEEITLSEIEKIERYIERTKIPRSIEIRYDMCFPEWAALCQDAHACDALYLAYTFGRAKGYRAGKKAAKLEQTHKPSVVRPAVPAACSSEVRA